MRHTVRLPDEQKPADMLAAVTALRRIADGLEQRAVKAALKEGWTWKQISEALGVSRQAAHKRLSHIASQATGTKGDKNV